MFWMKDIEWMRAFTRRNQIKRRKRNIRRNYKKVYREIKSYARLGFSQATIRFGIYDENVKRLQSEGYVVERQNLPGGPVLNIRW